MTSAESSDEPLAPDPSGAPPPAPGNGGGAASAPPATDGTDEGTGSLPLDNGSDAPSDAEVGGFEEQEGTGGTGAGSAGTEEPNPTVESPSDAGEPLPTPPVPCPGPTFEESCYEFIAERVSWSEARAACVTWGGQLVSVESLDEDSFLAAWPAQLGIAEGDGTGIWLGATDELQENAFLWPDNTPLTFTGWAANQPDNGAGLDCIEKRNDGTALWYDRRCTDLNPYVCERGL